MTITDTDLDEAASLEGVVTVFRELVAFVGDEPGEPDVERMDALHRAVAALERQPRLAAEVRRLRGEVESLQYELMEERE